MPNDRLRQIALFIWIAVGMVALGWVLLVIGGAIRVIWLPLAFAAGLVFLLEPVVRAFEGMRIPRPVGAVLALLVLLGLIVGFGALVWPAVQAQGVEFIQKLPDLYVSVVDWLRGRRWLWG